MNAKDLAEALLKLPLTSRVITVCLFLGLSAVIGLHFSPYVPWQQIPWYGSGGVFLVWATSGFICLWWLTVELCRGVKRCWGMVRNPPSLIFCTDAEKTVLLVKARDPTGSVDVPSVGGDDHDPEVDELRIAVEQLVERGFMSWAWMSRGEKAILTERGRRAAMRLVTKQRNARRRSQ